MKVPMKDQVGLDDLHDAVNDFTIALVESTDYIDDRKANMVSTLDKNIVEVNESLLSLLAELHSGVYIQPESDAKKVLDQVAVITSKIKALTSQRKQVNSAPSSGSQKKAMHFSCPVMRFGSQETE